MADKVVRYITCNRICPCDTTDVYLCVGDALTAAGTYTISASVTSVAQNTECCTNGNVLTYTYTFTYDETLLIDYYTLTTEDILGVVCDDCYAKWVKDQIFLIPIPEPVSCCCIEGNTNTLCGCDIFDSEVQTGALYNSIFGYQACNLFTTADKNTIIGYQQCYNALTMTNTIALGTSAMNNIDEASDVIIIGNYNLADTAPYHEPGIRTIAIGTDAGRFWYDSYDCILIGHQDYTIVTSGIDFSSKSIVIGNFSCANSVICLESVVIGHETSPLVMGQFYNVIIGDKACYQGVHTIAQNVIIGNESLYSFTGVGELLELYNSVFIGYRAGNDSNITNIIEMCYGLILIGANTAFTTVNGAVNNSIGIGDSVVVDKSDQVILGNSDVVETQLRRVLLAAGAAAVGSYPIKFQSGNLLGTPELGAMEFDGSKLYITTGAGRKEIAFV